MPRLYVWPASLNARTALRARAARRRTALAAAGCATYEHGAVNGQAALMCLCCGLGSVRPRDIDARFCGFCQAFHCEETPHDRHSCPV